MSLQKIAEVALLTWTLSQIGCSSTDFNEVGTVNGVGSSGANFGGAPSSSGGDAAASVGASSGVGGAEPVQTRVLCNGSSSLRFAAHSGGGNVSGIPTLMLEVGFEFLLVDGQCRYYAMTAPDQEIRTGTLAPMTAKSLSDDFLLGHWQGLENSGFGCSDAGSESFAFGADRAQSSCTTTPLTSALTAWLARLYDDGSPVTGDVRYGVIEASNEAWPQNSRQSALPYPFEDPTLIVTDPFTDMKPQLASGADARTLRALRTTYQGGPKPTPGPSYSVPVRVGEADDTAKYYNLVIRDTVPFETNGVLAIDDFIE